RGGLAWFGRNCPVSLGRSCRDPVVPNRAEGPELAERLDICMMATRLRPRGNCGPGTGNARGVPPGEICGTLAFSREEESRHDLAPCRFEIVPAGRTFGAGLARFSRGSFGAQGPEADHHHPFHHAGRPRLYGRVGLR